MTEPSEPSFLEIDRPDDWHLHLRDDEMLASVLPYTARIFGRAIVMPNLSPAIATTEAAERYANRIRGALVDGQAEGDGTAHRFEPLMTLYLTEALTPLEVERAVASSDVFAVKLYPKGATTNSAEGVAGLDSLGPTLEAMERLDLPLLIHGESTSPAHDVFDRERRFLESTLAPLVQRFPRLRVVFEHITTREAAEFVAEQGDRVAATITPQHLLLNRNAIFEGGIRPHHYCLPILKREEDRVALVAAAISGDPSFFLGTDSAPHVLTAKESDCGCAGIFSAPVAIECYAEAFAEAGALDRLEGFASHYGADFYGLPRNRDRIRLERATWTGPSEIGQAPNAVRVFWAGQPLRYRAVDVI